MIVRGTSHLGLFTFGVAIKANGDIIFVYEKVVLPFNYFLNNPNHISKLFKDKIKNQYISSI